MGYIGKYESTIFSNPANRYCIVSVKTSDTSVPAQARDRRRYRDHLIRFTAVGYNIPMTDAVELELEGEWVDSKYGLQLQVEQCREIVQKTEEGVLAYLGSGLIKGIGEKTAAQIVARFGVGDRGHDVRPLLRESGESPQRSARCHRDGGSGGGHRFCRRRCVRRGPHRGCNRCGLSGNGD